MTGVNFRKSFRALVPSWLGGVDDDDNPDESERKLFAFSLLQDAILERLDQGHKARFPSYAPDSALVVIGQDRKILRGRTEVSAHYAERLKRWRFPLGHRVRGNSYALLEQVGEYFGGAHVWSIDVSGNYYDRAIDGTETYTAAASWNWDGAGAVPFWARFWIGIDGTSIPGVGVNPSFGDPTLWGGSLTATGYTVGQIGITPDDAAAICNLVGPTNRTAWKPDNAYAEWVVVTLGGSAVPVTNGFWLHWSKQDSFGVQRPARDSSCRFWSLDPTRNNTYAGNAANYCTSSELVDGTTYAGDRTSYPSSTTLPDGTTYAGNPANYPASILLIDDATPSTNLA